MECIQYKKGYKYQLVEHYVVNIDVFSDQHINTDYIVLTPEGDLTIQKGYAWDGPSGPTIDTMMNDQSTKTHCCPVNLQLWIGNPCLRHAVNTSMYARMPHPCGIRSLARVTNSCL